MTLVGLGKLSVTKEDLAVDFVRSRKFLVFTEKYLHLSKFLWQISELYI